MRSGASKTEQIQDAHPERLVLNAAQHRRIMEAVRGGDPRQARHRMETHLGWGRSFTLDPDGRMGRG